MSSADPPGSSEYHQFAAPQHRFVHERPHGPLNVAGLVSGRVEHALRLRKLCELPGADGDVRGLSHGASFRRADIADACDSAKAALHGPPNLPRHLRRHVLLLCPSLWRIQQPAQEPRLRHGQTDRAGGRRGRHRPLHRADEHGDHRRHCLGLRPGERPSQSLFLAAGGKLPRPRLPLRRQTLQLHLPVHLNPALLDVAQPQGTLSATGGSGNRRVLSHRPARAGAELELDGHEHAQPGRVSRDLDF